MAWACARERDAQGERWDLLKDFLVGGLQHIDLVHYLVLTGGELIHGSRQRGETLLTCGELLDAFPQRCETLDHSLHLFWVERGGGGRFRGDRLWRSLGDGYRLAFDDRRFHLLGLRRPAEFWDSCRDYPLRCLAVGLPSQDGGNNKTSRDQVTGESSRGQPFYLVFYC